MYSLDHIVTLQNDIVRASYSFSIQEKELLWLILSKIKPTLQKKNKHTGDTDTIIGDIISPTEWYGVDIDSYVDIMKVSRPIAFARLSAAGRSMFERYITLYNTHSRKSELRFRWFSATLYEPETQEFKVKFTPDIIPFLTDLHSHFTQVKLLDSFCIQNEYAWKLFDLCSSYKTSKIRELEFKVSELESFFNVSEGYRNWHNMKTKILLPSFAILLEKELIEVKIIEEFKVGRKVTGVRLWFTFAKKSVGKVRDIIDVEDVGTKLDVKVSKRE